MSNDDLHDIHRCSLCQHAFHDDELITLDYQKPGNRAIVEYLCSWPCLTAFALSNQAKKESAERL